MASINDRATVDQLIANNGQYEDDSPVDMIVEYTNAWGGTTYGLVYPQDNPNRYAETEFVRNPKVIFVRGK